MSFDSGKTGAQVMAALAGGSGGAPISFKGGGTTTTAIPWQVTNISPNAKNFNFSLQTFAGVNLPAGDPRENNVFNMGWNVGTNGTREDPTQAMLRIAFEEHFVQPGLPAAFEWHLSSMDEAGQEHRPISCYLRKDGSAGSDLSMSVDVLGFNDYNYVQQVKWDFLNNVVAFRAGLGIRFAANNVVVLKQSNAAGNGTVNLPFVNSENQIQMEASTVTVGAAPTTGSYVGRFATIQCTSLANNGAGLSIETPSGNFEHDIIRAAAECQQAAKVCVWNNSGAAGGHAVLELRTLGAVAGDVFVRYNINGLKEWAVGVDNSDDDAFVWSNWLPGNNNAMRLDRNGTLSLPAAGGGLRVREGSNCKQGTATLAAGTVTVANTSVTANSRIFLTGQADGGTPGFVRVSSRVPGTSFTITSSSGTDTSTVAYEIFEPA